MSEDLKPVTVAEADETLAAVAVRESASAPAPVPASAPPAPFDISVLAAHETFDIEILNPNTGEPLIGDGGRPASVTAYGPGTKPFAAAKSRANNRAVARLKRRGKTDSTPEEEAAATAAFLTDITKSFNNFTYKGMENGPDTFRALYLDGAMGWLTDQVNGGAGDWANFTQASSTSS